MNFDGKVAVVTVVDRDEAAGQKLVEETGSNGKLALIDENAGDVCLRVRCQVGIQNRIGNVADLIWMSFRHRLRKRQVGKALESRKAENLTSLVRLQVNLDQRNFCLAAIQVARLELDGPLASSFSPVMRPHRSVRSPLLTADGYCQECHDKAAKEAMDAEEITQGN